ncbi:MAG: DUF2569 family protein, partial [Serratia grimesii]|uniref:DUF2569 family protein n=1 Tax=Serratia grimesii TaxID=82995 RepID=UPI003F9AF80A
DRLAVHLSIHARPELRAHRKKRQLPRFYIGLLLANILFLAIDLYLGNRYLDVALNYEESRPLIRNIIGACIWIPYFYVSVRVKRTFVH